MLSGMLACIAVEIQLICRRLNSNGLVDQRNTERMVRAPNDQNNESFSVRPLNLNTIKPSFDQLLLGQVGLVFQDYFIQEHILFAV